MSVQIIVVLKLAMREIVLLYFEVLDDVDLYMEKSDHGVVVLQGI